jgi:Leucine-rich repeat (LRR) protein
LITLDARASKVTDLSPLHGMPLRELILLDTPVSDITPLAGLPLVILDLSRTPVSDLAPLKGAPLAELYLEGAKVSDIAPLAGMPLDKLWLKDCPVADISPLSGMEFAELSLMNTQVTSIEVCRTMPSIGILWLRGTQVTDLSPLRDVEIPSLDVQATPVSDVSPLAGKFSLKRLNIAESAVTDLRPLAGLSLTRLIFTPSKIEQGLEIVRGMTSLQALDVQFEDANAVLSPPNSGEIRRGSLRPYPAVMPCLKIIACEAEPRQCAARRSMNEERKIQNRYQNPTMRINDNYLKLKAITCSRNRAARQGVH